MRISFVLIITIALSPALALAELPSPRFDRITPLGAVAGSEVEVQVQGSDIEDLQSLVFDNAGITAKPLDGKDLNKDRKFTVTIAADVPEGTYDARLLSKWGVSSPRLFVVSHGMADVAEKEPNNDPATAQLLSVNSALNGQSDGNDRDVFRLALKSGERVTIDCQSARLDTQLDAVMQVLSADEKQLASSGDYFGRDPFIDFTAPADGDYLIVVHDLSYRGGLPYRLIVSNRPFVENVFPRAIQLGKTVEVTAWGRNLNGQSEAKFSLAAPATAAIGRYTFLEHPTAHSVAPTAATCTLSGFQFRPDIGGPSLTPQTMLVVDSPVTLEQEPNDTLEKPQAITLPAVISGKFDQLRDADWYEFSVEENGAYTVEVYCERIAGQADPYVVFVDEKGNRFQQFDDFGIRTNAFDGHIRDCSGVVNLTAKQKYKVLVQDVYRRGGPRYQYVFAIRKPQPDFFVAAIHQQNPGPGGTTVRAGSAIHLDLIIHQTEGFKGPITVTAENLPAGVHSQPTTIYGNHGAVVLYADDNAANFDGVIKLTATGQRGDETITREVRSYARVWQDNPASSRPLRDVFLSVRETAPFGLQFDQDKLTVEAGKKVDVKILLKRHWPDFTGAASLQTFAFPGQIKANLPQFTAGANEGTITFEVQANTPPGDYTLTLLGQAQVPFEKDPKKGKANTLVTLACRPITITVTAAAK
ncbi:PPC domain-containing protein [Anatilimnocola floriformis]|uniref:PPC domain-containing protein n=1 Tax=Anatilimnocola floriformis TaxID=2948575 RepID=UPI0020C56574|nr:PPC domain-containing protein [Anatilimnocola floriformis]